MDRRLGQIAGGKAFGYSHGVVTDSRDCVFVFNTSTDAVRIFDSQGNFVGSWGDEFEGGAHGMFLSSENGSEFLLLTDHRRHLVVKATLDGQIVLPLGMPDRPDINSAEEEFRPTDVCVAPNGDFLIMDGYGKPWIHRYSANGEYLQSFGGEGSDPGKLRCPHGGWVDTRGTEPILWIADRGNNRIQQFTLDGRHVRFITSELT